MQLAIDHKNSLPQASEVIRRYFYVDDLLSGANSVTEVVKLQQQISAILLAAGFELRKWKSNESSILNQLKVSGSNDKFLHI